MDKQILQVRPDYKKIYEDLINTKYPHKMEDCRKLLDREELSVLNILTLNKIIFKSENEFSEKFNQKFRSYTKMDVLDILKYQKENELNNTQLARHFKLSRNTVAKWKKLGFIDNVKFTEK
ncbi:helix-turn-helix domain-containing protein [Chryseobacterium sp.]|uniref:helix-turn-helix domain-containing protein n=2 Tax=Chryseobacterium sp. TaxID=1871047 RepID=UPI0035C6C50B